MSLAETALKIAEVVNTDMLSLLLDGPRSGAEAFCPIIDIETTDDPCAFRPQSLSSVASSCQSLNSHPGLRPS